MAKQFLLASLALAVAAATDDYTPVVAVVSHPYNSTHESIPASYVKWLEVSRDRGEKELESLCI